MPVLQFTAWGRPVGQGSLGRNPHGFGSYETTRGHKGWRKECLRAIADAVDDLGGWEVLTGAVVVEAVCYGPRPKSHYGTGRNRDILKADAPEYPTGHGGAVNMADIDHLARAINDALKIGNVIKDDCIIVDLVVRKRYAAQPTGARAVVTVYAKVPPLVDAPVSEAWL